MDAVPLEKAPKVAVYAPPNAAPWDDAVTMALQYAGISLRQGLGRRSHRRQAPDLRLAAPASRGLYRAVLQVLSDLRRRAMAGRKWSERNQRMARQLGFRQRARREEGGGADHRGVRGAGGFLFAMCTATETLDLALASEDVDIAASFADGTPMDPGGGRQDALGQGAGIPERPARAVARRSRSTPRSTATRSIRRTGASRWARSALFNFSAKIDPVPTMLVQNHRQVIPDFYGLTTSFMQADPQARRHRAGRRGGRPVGQIHPRRARPGHLDVSRRARPGRSAAPGRAMRPRISPPTPIRRVTG